jgi:hypothetical protein
MGKKPADYAATIGFRVKTGRAIAVLLAGPVQSPRLLERCDVQLCDPDLPETREPYHAALELTAEAGANVVARAREAVQAIANRAVRDLESKLRAGGFKLHGVGLVVGSDRDPAKLGNPHIRAHASEGRLFREVLETGAAACGARSTILVESEAYAKAGALLGRSPEDLKEAIGQLGRAAGPPWGAEEKMATLAAWVVLHA